MDSSGSHNHFTNLQNALNPDNKIFDLPCRSNSERRQIVEHQPHQNVVVRHVSTSTCCGLVADDIPVGNVSTQTACTQLRSNMYSHPSNSTIMATTGIRLSPYCMQPSYELSSVTGMNHETYSLKNEDLATFYTQKFSESNSKFWQSSLACTNAVAQPAITNGTVGKLEQSSNALHERMVTAISSPQLSVNVLSSQPHTFSKSSHQSDKNVYLARPFHAAATRINQKALDQRYYSIETCVHNEMDSPKCTDRLIPLISSDRACDVDSSLSYTVCTSQSHQKLGSQLPDEQEIILSKRKMFCTKSDTVPDVHRSHQIQQSCYFTQVECTTPHSLLQESQRPKNNKFTSRRTNSLDQVLVYQPNLKILRKCSSCSNLATTGSANDETIQSITVKKNIGVDKDCPSDPQVSEKVQSVFCKRLIQSECASQCNRVINKVLEKPLLNNASSYDQKSKTEGAMKGNTCAENDEVKSECPSCCCGTEVSDAPYYTHLGAAENVQGIRRIFEARMGYSGHAIRIEKVIYTGKEGRTAQGCPMAKTVIRRSSQDEKVLIVCRQRPGHTCKTAVIVVIILLWDGVARPLADFAYAHIANYVPKHGEPTERRCATNEERTCACQGFDESTCGASFSFGCSWSMYYNGCKYARSHKPNKYKLVGTKDPEAEKFVGMICEKLATVMSPLYEMAAPDAFNNQVEHENDGYECRLGEARKDKSRPFSGVTSCLDFCAHSHKDQHNMDNGSTVVLTFTKPELRNVGMKHRDEQLHVLPLCKLDLSNEYGTLEGVKEKILSGSVEILDRYHHQVRLRSTPKLSKKQKSRAKKRELCTDSPSYKRKGRPPKQALSIESLFQSENVSNDFQLNPFTPLHFNRTDSSGPENCQKNAKSSTKVMHHSEPYDRANSIPHISYSCDAHNSAKQNPTTIDNLPSIKGFFDEPEPFIENGDAVFSLDVDMDIGKEYPPPSHRSSMSNAIMGPCRVMPLESSINSSNPCESLVPQRLINELKVGSQTTSTMISDQSYFLTYEDIQTNKATKVTAPEETILYSDCEESFLDSEIGGVAVAPGHGSVLIECAKKELHATTALRSPNRFYPSRISLVFYQHKSMNCRNHGSAEYEAKEEERRKQREKKLEIDTSQGSADEPMMFSPMNSPQHHQLGVLDPRNWNPTHGFSTRKDFYRHSVVGCQYGFDERKQKQPLRMPWNGMVSFGADQSVLKSVNSFDGVSFNESPVAPPPTMTQCLPRYTVKSSAKSYSCNSPSSGSDFCFAVSQQNHRLVGTGKEQPLSHTVMHPSSGRPGTRFDHATFNLPNIPVGCIAFSQYAQNLSSSSHSLTSRTDGDAMHGDSTRL